MASFAIENVAIRGVAACVPADIESNNDIDFIEPKELQALIKNVGVEFKRKVKSPVVCSDLCYASAKKLLEGLQWDPQEVGVLIYVSQSRDYILPCTAIILQDRLGLGKQTLAFDIPLGCSGYTYGLSVIAGLMSATKITKGLLLAGDTSTQSINYEDKKTFPLFGDAGSATALEFSADASPMYFDAGSDGSGYEAILIPGGGSRDPLQDEDIENIYSKVKQTREKFFLKMDGMKVFEFSISRVPSSIKSLLEYAATSPSDIDYFVMHQANMIMNETIRKKLKFTEAQAPYTLKNFGNTSVASIPLTMVQELRESISKKANTMLLSGFGVGLSWSSVILKTNELVVPELIEYA